MTKEENEEKKIIIGENIKNLRTEQGLTQEQLAEQLEVTFQAVSSWERDEYLPELKNLIKMAEAFDVSLDKIVDGRKYNFKTKEAIYDWEHMKTFVKTTAKSAGMSNTLSAVDFAVAAHEGQTRKRSDMPYIYHPLNMACHALSMGITKDEVIAAILLHDVIEDCRKEDGSAYTPDDLPVNDEARELVRLMTKDKTKGSHDPEALDKYYGDIAKNPKAALIKCIDRCNNMTTMSWGFTRDAIFRYIEEVEKYFPELLKVVKSTPEYNNAAWLLQYQMESMLDIFKRLM